MLKLKKRKVPLIYHALRAYERDRIFFDFSCGFAHLDFSNFGPHTKMTFYRRNPSKRVSFDEFFALLNKEEKKAFLYDIDLFKCD